jgi:hypothetical protein
VTVTVTATPSDSGTGAGVSAQQPGPGIGGAVPVDAAAAAQSQSKAFLSSMLRGDKVGALSLMTPAAAKKNEKRSPQNILGVGDADEFKAGCQLGAAMPLRAGIDYSKHGADPSLPDFQAVAYKIVCTTMTNSVLVTTTGADAQIASVRGGYLEEFSDES